MSYELIWFKRDLRWHDHAALARAGQIGAVRCICVIEPELWRQPDAALQHFEFMRESLLALDAELRRRGGGIEVHVGEWPEVLDRLWRQAPFAGLHSHEETGNGFTYARDLRVQAWCHAHGACSRLSPYLAWGCISMREVVQQTREHLAQLPEQATRHRAGLLAFLSRLYWHCHFIQKLETEPEIEWRNMHRGYDDLREPEFNAEHFEALINARTGWPMVDACVTMLRETGWLNFRMRAMLVSVAAYPLWLHWRPVGEWLPAMRRVPDEWLFEPWLMPPMVQEQLGLRVGTDIVMPVVDLKEATKAAKQRLYERRHNDDVKAGKQAVIDKHASRKNWRMNDEVKSKPRRSSARRSSQAPTPSTGQMGFDF
ncbi:MAG: FAD-binding domain-containing protein [Alphaproteobacteria bacterium]|nr:FAD-binding domain-containing protein [Alphaproteobacteria bacterium]